MYLQFFEFFSFKRSTEVDFFSHLELRMIFQAFIRQYLNFEIEILFEIVSTTTKIVGI